MRSTCIAAREQPLLSTTREGPCAAMKTQHSEKKKFFLSSFQQSEQSVGGQGQRQGHQLGSEGYNDVGIDQGDTTGCGISGQNWGIFEDGINRFADGLDMDFL